MRTVVGTLAAVVLVLAVGAAPAAPAAEGSRENTDGKWSWISPAQEAPEAGNWRVALGRNVGAMVEPSRDRGHGHFRPGGLT